MRVLLVSPNKEQLPDPVFPLGLAYIASALIREGHMVHAADLAFAADADAALKSAVEGFKPDVIGMSLRNIDDVAYPRRHSYIGDYKQTVGTLRGLTNAPIVLGGSGFTIMPREFMKELGADYGIRGEGEEAFPELLKNIAGSRRLSPVSRVKNLDALRPAVGLFDAGAYYKHGGMLNVQTKRGCSFKCIYCTYPRVEGRRIRTRDPKIVADEIKRLVDETGVKHYFMVDSVFNNPPRHAREVCKAIINGGLDIKWNAYCSPHSMDPELIELMLRAGCTGVEFGVDALTNDGLIALKKGFNIEQAKKSASACKKAGLKFCIFMFIGYPGDTLNSALESIKTLEEIGPDAAVIMAGIRVFPKTELASIAGINKIGLAPEFYISPEVLENLEPLSGEISKHKTWVMPGLEINIHERLQRKLRDMGVKGSLWEELTRRRGGDGH